MCIDFGRHHGLCLAFSADDKIIAGTRGTRVGHDYFGDVQTFDPDYAKYPLGTLCMPQTIGECIARGVPRYHLLWGRNDHKTQLGGEPQALCVFVAYRSAASRVAHVYDACRAWRWR